MTEEREQEVLEKVRELLYIPHLEKVESECAQFVLQSLNGWTSQGRMVRHLNDQYVEILELLWEQLIKDNPLRPALRVGIHSFLSSDIKPCGGCGQSPPTMIVQRTESPG